MFMKMYFLSTVDSIVQAIRCELVGWFLFFTLCVSFSFMQSANADDISFDDEKCYMKWLQPTTRLPRKAFFYIFSCKKAKDLAQKTP